MALENLATATQADRKSVAMLTKIIAELSTQFSNLTAKLGKAQSDNTRLEKLGHSSSPSEHENRLSNNQAASDQNPLRDRNVYARSGHKFDLNRY